MMNDGILDNVLRNKFLAKQQKGEKMTDKDQIELCREVLKKAPKSEVRTTIIGLLSLTESLLADLTTRTAERDHAVKIITEHDEVGECAVNELDLGEGYEEDHDCINCNLCLLRMLDHLARTQPDMKLDNYPYENPLSDELKRKIEMCRRNKEDEK